MKKLIIALIIILAATPVFASKFFDFTNSVDTAGWAAVWNTSYCGTIGLSIVAGHLQVTVTKDSASSDGVNVRYANPPITSSDSVWSIYGKSITPIQPPWCYTKAWSRDNGWSWHDAGVAANMSASWQQFANIRNPMGVTPYQDIGFQVFLGTEVGTFTFQFDNAKFGDSLTIPVELIDFEATPTK